MHSEVPPTPKIWLYMINIYICTYVDNSAWILGSESMGIRFPRDAFRGSYDPRRIRFIWYIYTCICIYVMNIAVIWTNRPTVGRNEEVQAVELRNWMVDERCSEICRIFERRVLCSWQMIGILRKQICQRLFATRGRVALLSIKSQFRLREFN